MKRVIALIGLFIMSLPTLLMAQEQGTYIENLGAQDSSYMEEDLLSPVQQSSGSTISVMLIVLVAAVIILFISALVSVLKGKFEGNGKIIWIVVILILPILGPILYFLIGKKQRIN